jgi:hypothetical protein
MIMNEDKSPEGRASLESGLKIDICEQILTKFERIKNEHSSTSSLLINDTENLIGIKKPTKLKKFIFQRQRSHSATHN